MNPEQNPTPQNITGMDYLEQISTKPPSKFSFINRKLLIAAIIFVVVLVVLLIVTAVVSNRGQTSSEALSVKLSSLTTLIQYDKNNEVNNSAVNKTVAEASLVVASSKNQLGTVVTLPTPSKDALAAEAIDQTTADLDTAKAAGDLSGEYTIVLIEKFDEAIALLTSLRDSASSADNKQTIEQILLNFSEIRDRLSAA